MVRTNRSANALRFGGTGRQTDHLNAGGGERLAERQRKQGIPIVDQEAFTRQKAIAGIRQIATHLAHPGGVGLRRGPGDLNAARREFDDEEHGDPCQAAPGPDIDRKEVRRGRTSQWIFRNSVQVVFFTRSGAGSRPCSRRTVAMVPRDTR
jgi:hypothetical protein